MKEDVKPAVETRKGGTGKNPEKRKMKRIEAPGMSTVDPKDPVLCGEPSMEGWVVHVLADEIREMTEVELLQLLSITRERM